MNCEHHDDGRHEPFEFEDDSRYTGPEISEELIRQAQEPEVEENQAVFDTGLDDARISRLDSPSANRQVFELRTDGFAGPDVDYDGLRATLAGMSFGEAKSMLENLPGVNDFDLKVHVRASPWSEKPRL
jgi:hypothetical protein